MEYLIAGEINFSSSRHVLVNVTTSDEVRLPPAAALILLILVRNHGKVVERNSFIDIAWKEYGLELSGNTLSQYISLLRKNFIRLGIESEVIITLPRVGFCFSNKIEVNDSTNTMVKTRGKNLKRYLFLTALLVLLLEMSVFFSYSPSWHRSDLVKLGTLNGCDIFSTHNLTNAYSKTAETIASALSSKYLPCRKNAVFLFDADGGLVFQHDGRAFLGRCDVSPVTGKFAGCQEVVIYETR